MFLLGELDVDAPVAIPIVDNTAVAATITRRTPTLTAEPTGTYVSNEPSKTFISFSNVWRISNGAFCTASTINSASSSDSESVLIASKTVSASSTERLETICGLVAACMAISSLIDSFFISSNICCAGVSFCGSGVG